jgi:hypothetical protein
MNPYQRKVRTIISWSLTVGLIIIWAVPVAVSNGATVVLTPRYEPDSLICTPPS